MKEKVLKTIEQYQLIENGDKLVLGVSGGPDSIAMLHILQMIRESKIIDFDIVVAHVNHGIRENAKEDEAYVLKFCEKMGVKTFVLHTNIKQLAKQKKCGIEETGRMIRYQFFNQILYQTKSNKIAIAHNNNDSVETIIMNMIRGCGITGLKGIEAKSGRYIRPLVHIKREEIEAYCNENELHPRYDESNADNQYTRNKIRNIVIPYIERELNPNIINTINRLSEISYEESNYWENHTAKVYKKICLEERKDNHNTDDIIEKEENISKENVYNKENVSTIILDLKKFNEEEVLMQKKIIFYAIQKLFGTTKGIEKIHMDDIIKLCNKGIGNKFLMPNQKTKIVIKNKKIYVIAVK